MAAALYFLVSVSDLVTESSKIFISILLTSAKFNNLVRIALDSLPVVYS